MIEEVDVLDSNECSGDHFLNARYLEMIIRVGNKEIKENEGK